MPATLQISFFRALAAATLALPGIYCLPAGPARAQTHDDDPPVLRGTVEEDRRSPAERRRAARDEDLEIEEADADAGEDETEEVPADAIVTGAVTPVNPVNKEQWSGQENPSGATVEILDRIEDPNPYEAVGIRVGRFILRPTITQQIGYENSNDDETRTERSLSRTTLTAELQSDWERNAFKLTAEQVIDVTLSGDGPESPSTSVDAELRLDLARTTTATLALNYDFYREDQSDANAVQGAVAQSDVHAFGGSAALEHSFGTWKSRATFAAAHAIYGDVELSDGSELDQSDRDNTSYNMQVRVGSDTGAVLQPFVEGEYTRTVYDETVDVNGFARSSNTYEFRAGIAFDRGEKFSGELAAGYIQRDYDDTALDPIKAFEIAGNLKWSPERDTVATLALTTSIEDSTTPDVSGSVYYEAGGTLVRNVREDLETRLNGAVGWRTYFGALPEETVMRAGAGFTWWLNRNLGIDGDVSYERTISDEYTDDDFYIGMGMTLQK
jgi:hypothetical protein